MSNLGEAIAPYIFVALNSSASYFRTFIFPGEKLTAPTYRREIERTIIILFTSRGTVRRSSYIYKVKTDLFVFR